MEGYTVALKDKFREAKEKATDLTENVTTIGVNRPGFSGDSVS